MKYTLTMDEKTFDLLVWALDLYSRIYLGQLEEVLWTIQNDPAFPTKDLSRRIVQLEALAQLVQLAQRPLQSDALDDKYKVANFARDLLNVVRALVTGFPAGASYGIHSPEVDDRARQAYDIQQVIRHRLAWDRNPEGGITVNFDSPMRTSTEQLELPFFVRNEKK